MKKKLVHIRVFVCNYNDLMYEYISNLWKLVMMGKNTGIGLGLTRIQGSGKSNILEYFGEKILGKRQQQGTKKTFIASQLLGQKKGKKKSKVLSKNRKNKTILKKQKRKKKNYTYRCYDYGVRAKLN